MEKTKILIIEDDEAIADLLSYGLTSEGFETCTVNNGSSGMRKLDQFKPDLLLLDWIFAGLRRIGYLQKSDRKL